LGRLGNSADFVGVLNGFEVRLSRRCQPERRGYNGGFRNCSARCGRALRFEWSPWLCGCRFRDLGNGTDLARFARELYLIAQGQVWAEFIDHLQGRLVVPTQWESTFSRTRMATMLEERDPTRYTSLRTAK
jgi:hypothetical protein